MRIVMTPPPCPRLFSRSFTVNDSSAGAVESILLTHFRNHWTSELAAARSADPSLEQRIGHLADAEVLIRIEEISEPSEGNVTVRYTAYPDRADPPPARPQR
jgi:hypothetical protein